MSIEKEAEARPASLTAHRAASHLGCSAPSSSKQLALFLSATLDADILDGVDARLAIIDCSLSHPPSQRASLVLPQACLMAAHFTSGVGQFAIE